MKKLKNYIVGVFGAVCDKLFACLALLAPNVLRVFVCVLTCLFGIVVEQCAPKVITNSLTTEKTYKDTSVVIKGDDVKAAITDSIMNVLRSLQAQGKPAVIEYRNTPESNTHMTFSLDKSGNLQADCETKDSTIKFLLEHIRTLQQKTEIIYQVPEWAKIVMCALGLYALVTTLILIIKR